jgi:DNA-binding response OmpR family regulator
MSPDQRTVLIADDEAPIRLLVRVNLEAEGYRVIEATDGVSTLEIVRQDRPDVILLDVMMPHKDGWQVAEELLGDEELAAIPVIFLTARADLRDHERGLVAGALQYITKPFNPRELATCVEDAIKIVQSGDPSEVRADRLRLVRDMRAVPE